MAETMTMTKRALRVERMRDAVAASIVKAEVARRDAEFDAIINGTPVDLSLLYRRVFEEQMGLEYAALEQLETLERREYLDDAEEGH